MLEFERNLARGRVIDVVIHYESLNKQLDENDQRTEQVLNELKERRDEIGDYIKKRKANAIRLADGNLAYPTNEGRFVYIDDDGNATSSKEKRQRTHGGRIGKTEAAIPKPKKYRRT